MKNLPDKITRSEIMVAYAEGKKVYYDGKRRGYNPFADLAHEELTAAWFSGWDDAQAETHGKGDITPRPAWTNLKKK
jgi:hypothetical protein